MGKSEWERQLLHFSHDHPLVLTNMTEAGHECFGCKSAATGWIYRCNTCNFDLHFSCYAIPPQIRHPSDIHPLNLLARPVYEGGIFKCDACGQDSTGFPFHCSLCQTDLHPSCANLQLQFNHPNHPHTLGLSFTCPYLQKIFYCDVCKQPGKDSWLYHCSQCFFDIHVTCINVTSQSNRNPNLPQPEPRNPNFLQPEPLTASRSINVSSSPINSTVSTLRNYLPKGILQRPAGPSRPPMFNQMPVAGQSVARGSSQIGPPSYQTIICQGFVKGAAQSAGSSLMKMAFANFTSDSSGNYNDSVNSSTAFDSNSSGDAGSGAFDYSNSGGFDTSGIQGDS